jgi:hypothetical protein
MNQFTNAEFTEFTVFILCYLISVRFYNYHAILCPLKSSRPLAISLTLRISIGQSVKISVAGLYFCAEDDIINHLQQRGGQNE